jgi:predicted GNAT family N-acyltransferase
LTVTVRTARDPAEVEAAKELRVKVFCDEQGVDASEELDEFDDLATHLIAVDETGVLATCRLREVDAGAWKLERMAVGRDSRDLGVGARLLAGAEREARDAGAATMVLNAQVGARRFYVSHGYEPEGETFMEAGIEHIRMTKAL